MAGKGSDRRPLNTKYCSPEDFRKNWDTIFSTDTTNKEKEESDEKEDTNTGS